MLLFMGYMGSQIVGHDLVTEQQHIYLETPIKSNRHHQLNGHGFG